MSALPADGVVRAAIRWWQLLGRSPLPQAWAVIRADAAYADLSPTQYMAALDWLQATGSLVPDASGLVRHPRLRELPHRQVMRLLLQRSLERARPAWLPDADVLVPDATELPQDALRLAEGLNVTTQDAFLAISQAQRKVDLERRTEIGATGERVLVERLQGHWPGCATQVSLEDDGLGFDIVLALNTEEWHMEVKTTTRRGRLIIYLSRNEHEVSLLDPAWRLVVVGLEDDGALAVTATVRPEVVTARAPRDQHPSGRWESLRLELMPTDLEPGLHFLRDSMPTDPVLAGSYTPLAHSFAWMPMPSAERTTGDQCRT